MRHNHSPARLMYQSIPTASSLLLVSTDDVEPADPRPALTSPPPIRRSSRRLWARWRSTGPSSTCHGRYGPSSLARKNLLARGSGDCSEEGEEERGGLLPAQGVQTRLVAHSLMPVVYVVSVQLLEHMRQFYKFQYHKKIGEDEEVRPPACWPAPLSERPSMRRRHP